MENKIYEILMLKHIHASPDADSEVLGEVNPGDLINVDDNIKGWLHIVGSGYVFSGFGCFAKAKNPHRRPLNRRMKP